MNRIIALLNLTDPRLTGEAPKRYPSELHGLPVLTPRQAEDEGYVSITTDICLRTEESILLSVCNGRNPLRACLIRRQGDAYQLCIRSQDLSKVQS